MKTPACFDSDEQYSDWLDKEADHQVPQRIDSAEPNYCFDCTWAHKAKMQLEGRCGFPKTIFVRVPEPKAGNLEMADEFVGVTAGAPTRVSSPSSDHSLIARPGSSSPTPTHPSPSSAQTQEGSAQYKASSGPKGPGRGTGLVP